MIKKFDNAYNNKNKYRFYPPDFVKGIKKLFPHKIVEISIQPADTTDYILSNPEYTRVLQERIEKYEAKKKVISLKADDLV